MPGTLRQLENRVATTKRNFEYQTTRLERHVDSLAQFETQVENCTIRCAHDGFLIYANDPNRNFFIEPGIAVRQNQTLFYLPDLAKMEVKTLIHESIVQKVRDGMRTKVRVEGAPQSSARGPCRLGRRAADPATSSARSPTTSARSSSTTSRADSCRV